MGILVFSALISVISAGLDSKIDEARKGRSRVLETDHTIILNWSASIFDIISEAYKRVRPAVAEGSAS